ncbi:phosphatidylglycerol lysyltransferase domain-containing protein [Pedobacter sp. ASV28]|uniref:phosphatidylglycerol lysyltransferase domain-containing protein n=1 Tax=Pedobacter sp. ASV28 TaxID=2795123 RepID=UPI001E5D6D92|nr:phosphatidylglycerol lysyltransferase domain-containing protein [Pedobacter sp. ASV28]
MMILANRFKTFHLFTYLKEHGKIMLQFLLAVFFIGMGAWFVLHESTELKQVGNVISLAKPVLLWLGTLVTLLYIFCNALMYQASFQAVGAKVRVKKTFVLFLKRNLISVFLPAGGVSSLAFFSAPIEKGGISRSQITYASILYGFIGILTVILLAIPVFIWALFVNPLGTTDWLGLCALLFLVIGLYIGFTSFVNKGFIYRILAKNIPALEVIFEEMANNKINKKAVFKAISYSMLIEFFGVLHLYIAMSALGVQASVFIAFIGYVIAVVFMVISPFLRGLGAVELSITFLLTRFGLSNVEALSVTFLYRFFEFWFPLIAGIFAFLSDIRKLLFRVLPAIVLILLGLVNIISVLTPAISKRLELLQDFLPIGLINASNYLVFASGLLLLVTSIFMLKGLRNAWNFAMILTLVSLFGNIGKAFDYEEASLAFLVGLILWSTRKQYYVKTHPGWIKTGLKVAFFTIAVTMAYGVLGFYFLDKKHFGIDFTLAKSVVYTLQHYFLLGSELQPRDDFSLHFLYSISLCGIISIGFFIYCLLRPYVFKWQGVESELQEAKLVVAQHGHSALDYFKYYPDKFIYWVSESKNFIAYRISGSFAVVLENPVVAKPEDMPYCIKEFDEFCYANGLKSIYYRVPETSLATYLSCGKQKLFLGQEGVVELASFSLEGGKRKSLRNSIKKIQEKGYVAKVHVSPQKNGFMQQLKQVSDDWLLDTGRKEMVFSQGMFMVEELKNQVIISVEDAEEKIVAFLNVIPSYATGEGTYDLIRKTADAPSGVIDFLMVELFNYLGKQGCTSVNLGLAPMSGLEAPTNLAEKSIRFAYDKIKAFSHYRGLRDFKEKFDPIWTNQYLIYEQDYDLLQIPNTLNHVIRP